MSRFDLVIGLLHFLVFFMGAGIGSFLNVVIYRLPLGISVNNPRRSFCPSCKKQIPWYQNIPILSWIALRGKCSACGCRISPRYVGVELLVGVLFYLIFRRFGGDWAHPMEWFPQVLCLWVFVSLLVAGTFIDIEHFILPHEITIGGTVAGLIAATCVPDLLGEETHLRGFLLSLASAALGLGGLWLVVELGKLAFGKLSFRQKPRFVVSAPRFVASLVARFMSCQWLDGPVDWSIGQPNEEEPPVLQFGDEKLGWADIFMRANDRLLINCADLQVHVKLQPQADDSEIDIKRFADVKAEVRMETLKVTTAAGGTVGEFNLEGVKQVQGTATELVIPREAMGFGDVLFLMMIGTFVGWQGVLFAILAASVLGTLIAGFWKLIGRSEWSAKIPFGPYLAAGAMIWMFYGHPMLAWYLQRAMWR